MSLTSADKFESISIFFVLNSSWISFIVWPEKGGAPIHTTVQELIQHDSQTPNVNFESMLSFDDDLWRHVLVGATNAGSHIQLGGLARPSEVAQLDVEPIVQKQVFGFYVSVDDVVLVQELHSQTRLVEKPHCQILRQTFVRVDVEKQTPVRRTLEQNVEVAFGETAANVTNDARVGQRFVEVDFNLQVVNIRSCQFGKVYLLKKPLLERICDCPTCF